MWIEPTTFSPESGQIVGVRLRVGQDLLGDPVPRDPALINQFVVEDAGGRKPLVGRDGADPAGFLRVAMPGLLVIGYQQQPERRRADGRKVQSVPEGRRARRGRRAESPPQRDRREGPRALLALREEPGAVGIGEARDRAIGRSALRSSSSPSGIRTRFAPVRIFPFA